MTAEAIALLKNDVEFEFIVDVDGTGKVHHAKIARSRPPDGHLRLLNYAQRCVEAISFAAPPHQPYQMNTIVKFSAQKRAWPE
ncbi:MAG TPA: hypothetical protein VNA69_06180 [Thermoanaerobaculia bacterium]|nr:hypothetical protein [Thermoanaerobaculia bacterium]